MLIYLWKLCETLWNLLNLYNNFYKPFKIFQDIFEILKFRILRRGTVIYHSLIVTTLAGRRPLTYCFHFPERVTTRYYTVILCGCWGVIARVMTVWSSKFPERVISSKFPERIWSNKFPNRALSSYAEAESVSLVYWPRDHSIFYIQTRRQKISVDIRKYMLKWGNVIKLGNTNFSLFWRGLTSSNECVDWHEVIDWLSKYYTVYVPKSNY